MAASDFQFGSETRKSFILQEFVECYKLPVCAKVVGCRGLELRSPETPIRCGDYIYLQTLAVDNVSLSFYDADTGSKREVRVPADSNMKFNVITSASSDSEVIMPTVADVIDSCPMKFRANTEHDDPYLPIIFKKGEEFRYLRKCRCPGDGTVYLECEDGSGNVIQLPKSCRGNFSVVEDKTSYSLREIISFGPVSRKLRLSGDNIKLLPVDKTLETDPESPLYTNLENDGGTLSRITGLPLTFNGVITMRAPDLFLLASTRDNADDRWRVPLDLDIDLILWPDDQYEEPNKKERILFEFISDFEQDLPLVATISGYENIPKEFRKVLTKHADILVHQVETSEKILAKCKGNYFCIGKGLNGRFRRALKRFESISELVSNDKVVTVKVMEEVASDVPEPFSLKVGDLIKFENFNIQTIKIKYSKKHHVKCDTIVCQKIEADETKQLRLPVDLDVSMIEILPENEQDGDDIKFVFSRHTEFPLVVDFLPIHHCSRQVLPYDNELELISRVSDPLVLISPLPPERNRRVSGLDAKVEPCLLVPVRHKLFLKIKSKLNFPSSYFRLPKRGDWINLEAEKITEEIFNRLLKYNDQAYEDYDPRSRSRQTGEVTEFLVEMNDNSNYKQLRRKGASLTILPQLKKHSKIFTKKDKKYRSDSNLAGSTKDEGETSEPDTEGERIYELYEPPCRKEQDKKSSKTFKSKLMKRLSLRKKKDSNG